MVAGALLFHRLGDRDLWSSHEARAAMDAESLRDPDALGLPRLHDGRLELQKPPLYYWLVAGVGRLRGGIDGWAVRLPSALSAVGVLLTVGLGVGVGFRRPVAGLLAALLLATGIHFPWLARIGRIDMPLTFAVTLAGMGFALAVSGRRTTFALAYFACALGVLLKGPIGLVLPGVIVAAILVSEGRWPACWEWAAWGKLLRRLRVGWGLLLVALLTAPVFAWLEYASGGQFAREFFWHHNVERGLGGARLRTHPILHYVGYFLLYFLPWSLLFPLAWPRFWRNDRVARLGLAWLVGVGVVLSLASFKRADYLLPAYPGAAIFLGCWLDRLPWRRTALAGVAVVASVMVVGWAYRIGWSLPAEEPYRDYRPFAAVVREHAPSPQTVIFFRAEAHALAFRVGRPLDQVVQWHDLQRRLRDGDARFVVLPVKELADASASLAGVELEVIADTETMAGGRHERPLALLRAHPVCQPSPPSPRSPTSPSASSSSAATLPSRAKASSLPGSTSSPGAAGIVK